MKLEHYRITDGPFAVQRAQARTDHPERIIVSIDDSVEGEKRTARIEFEIGEQAFEDETDVLSCLFRMVSLLDDITKAGAEREAPTGDHFPVEDEIG